MSSKGIENPIIACDDIEDLIKEIKIFDNPSSHSNNKNSIKILQLTKALVSVDFTNENTTFVQALIPLRRKFKINPKNSEIVDAYRHLVATKEIERNVYFEDKMKLKKSRSNSGVVVITVLTSPGKFSCPQDCFYCPDERDEHGTRIMPRSYISEEPACRRGTQTKFDPVLQFFIRASTLGKKSLFSSLYEKYIV